MLPTDMLTLRDRLAELADVFERKAVTEKALKVWFDTLREFPIERVAGVLLGWPKSHNKFPTPADLWKVCSEIGSAEMERRAMLDKVEVEWVPSTRGDEFLAKMKAVISRPKRTPREHWEHVLTTQRPGSEGYEYAKKILKRDEREPGSDEEEAVNF